MHAHVNDNQNLILCMLEKQPFSKFNIFFNFGKMCLLDILVDSADSGGLLESCKQPVALHISIWQASGLRVEG